MPFRLQRMEALLQLCDPEVAKLLNHIGTDFTNSGFFDVISQIAPEFHNTMFSCNWRNDDPYCFKNFRTTITEEGVCYTFNALNSRDIYTDEYDFVSKMDFICV